VVTQLERNWPGYWEIETRRIDGGTSEDGPDAVAVEHHLTVVFEDRSVATLACTPRELGELVAGFLLGQGLISAGSRPADIGFNCVFSPDRRVARVRAPGYRPPAGGRKRERVEEGNLITSGCGAGLVWDQARVLVGTRKVEWAGTVSSEGLRRLVQTLRESPLFRLTGGTHSALAAEMREAPETAAVVMLPGATAPVRPASSSTARTSGDITPWTR